MSEEEGVGEGAQLVPGGWRPTLKAVVAAFAAGDYELSAGIEGVERPTAATAAQIRDYIADYGGTLDELPEASWQTSLWQRATPDSGNIIVDLWTVESGRSDMVLDVSVDIVAGSPKFTVHSVYVP